jgi:hypothetical protein
MTSKPDLGSLRPPKIVRMSPPAIRIPSKTVACKATASELIDWKR